MPSHIARENDASRTACPGVRRRFHRFLGSDTVRARCTSADQLRSGGAWVDRREGAVALLPDGFVYIETTIDDQTAVTAYPAHRAESVEGLRPGLP